MVKCCVEGSWAICFHPLNSSLNKIISETWAPKNLSNAGLVLSFRFSPKPLYLSICNLMMKRSRNDTQVNQLNHPIFSSGFYFFHPKTLQDEVNVWSLPTAVLVDYLGFRVLCRPQLLAVGDPPAELVLGPFAWDPSLRSSQIYEEWFRCHHMQ